MNHAQSASSLVLGDRNASYGTPATDFAGVALMWTGLLSEKLAANITATDVALMMAALKLRRHAHRPKDDNIIDAHGYLLCLEWIETGRQPEALHRKPDTPKPDGQVDSVTHDTLERIAALGEADE